MVPTYPKYDVFKKLNNCPNPGPHQNWIEQPYNAFLTLGDQNASFYTFPYEVDPETEIVIKGRYPYARYFPFNIPVPKNKKAIIFYRISQYMLPEQQKMESQGF